MDYVTGGLAGVGAGIFSNPFDVVKVRMQLQGELKARGQHVIHYKNVFHAMYTIVKHDGYIALQKGLVPALWSQLVVNGTRLGVYQQADDLGYLRDENNQTKIANSITMGAIAGMIGAFVGSPFQLIKTQVMAHSAKEIAVGTQHAHKGTCYAISDIYKKHGITGLWRGANSMIARNSIGSSSQIASFACTKDWLLYNGWFADYPYIATTVASIVAGFVKTVFMTPMDVIVTRLYNQGVDSNGRGMLYLGIIDCAVKINATEGFLAFYKGFVPSYIRQAPHSIMLLVFWDLLKDLQRRLTDAYKL